MLLMVKLCVWAALPTVVSGKARLPAERTTTGPSPVPLTAICCGEPLALGVMTTSSASAPIFMGLKMTEMVQDLPAATEEPQLLVSVNDMGLAPLTAIELMASAELPGFLSVTGLLYEVFPTGSAV